MWYLFHKLFGWHYILLHDCDEIEICRVIKTPNGNIVGKVVCRAFIIHPDGTVFGGYNIHRWEPLTWNPKSCQVKSE